MTIVPCSLCGYHAPLAECPHCGGTPLEKSLRARPAGQMSGTLTGFWALPKGLAILFRSPWMGVYLLPPLVITGTAFALAAWWTYAWLQRLLEAARLQSIESLGLEPGFWQDVLAWCLQHGVVLALAKASGTLVFLVSMSFVALWTFSIVYELIAGPFLDAVQGRLEARWFGRDPRQTLDGTGWRAFVVAEARTLLASLQATLLAFFVMAAFFWLKFVPVLGYFLFAGVAGFATALSLLDIPLSRRRWSFLQRLEFVLAHMPAVLAFGLSASVLFMIPILGPIVGVPAASFGGLWLCCRLDKTSLRPPGHPATIARTRASTPG